MTDTLLAYVIGALSRFGWRVTSENATSIGGWISRSACSIATAFLPPDA